MDRKEIMETLLNDRRAADLLTRVREDISSLRHDVKHLMAHTGRHTIPDAIRDGSEQARDGLRRVGRAVRDHPTGLPLGGALLVGALAAGVWLLVRGNCEE
jgi:hypothetical protein